LSELALAIAILSSDKSALLSAKWLDGGVGYGDDGGMPNQVAVLSDIHGVLPVLEAILAEPDIVAADKIVITGDHVAGPQPVEVLDRLTALSDRVVLVDSPVERWTAVLGELPDQVRTVVCGHTHMPYVRLVDRRTVINPGSVGMPYGTIGGAWALLRDGQVSLRRTPTEWADDYLTGSISDLEALTAMRPRTL
jgi:predicted phosphodiesterase